MLGWFKSGIDLEINPDNRSVPGLSFADVRQVCKTGNVQDEDCPHILQGSYIFFRFLSFLVHKKMLIVC